MWNKSKLDRELRELSEREELLRTIKLSPKKNFRPGVWAFLIIESIIVLFAISYGFLELFINAILETVRKPIMALSILDVLIFIGIISIVVFVWAINKSILGKEDEEDENL